MVFYFTGTGNSLYVARELDASLVSIPQAMRKGELTWEADSIGIVCPIYGHEMPAMVKEFIRKAELKTDYFYIVLTYGARHGGAAEIAGEFLASVGKTADYITTIMMVDNFLPVFDMNEETQTDKQVEPHLAEIKADVQARKRGMQTVTDEDRAIHRMYLEMVKGQPEKNPKARYRNAHIQLKEIVAANHQRDQ